MDNKGDFNLSLRQILLPSFIISFANEIIRNITISSSGYNIDGIIMHRLQILNTIRNLNV